MQIDIRSLTVSVDNLTDLTEESFENLNTTAKNGFGNLGGKMDQTPNRQEETNRERTNLMNMMTPHIQRRSRQLGTELTETWLGAFLTEMALAIKHDVEQDG